MMEPEKDLILQKRVERAVDAALSSLSPSAWEQQSIINKMTEGKPMKKRLPVGLVVAVVLLLLTVTAIAAVLLTPQEVVEQVAVPLAQNNDTEWRVNNEFSPEELARFIQACAENGIDLNENSHIMRAFRNGEGYWEDEAIMEVCRQAFGGTIGEWTIDQRNWFYDVTVQLGLSSEAYHEDGPGPDDLPEEEARAIMYAAVQEAYGVNLTEAREQYEIYVSFIPPWAEDTEWDAPDGGDGTADTVWHMSCRSRGDYPHTYYYVSLDRAGNVLGTEKYVEPPIERQPYRDTREFSLTKEEAAQLAADGIRAQTGADVPLMDEETFHCNIFKSAEGLSWDVTFISHSINWGACKAMVNDATGEVTVTSADVGGLTADNILTRFRAEYGWFGDWPQERWVELAEMIRNLPPAETVAGKALQASPYIPERDGLLTRLEAEEIAFRTLNIRFGEFNCGVLIDADPNPIWKFRVLPYEKYDGTYVMEIDAVTGEIVDQDMYISDHMDLEPSYHMYTLHRTWAKIVMETNECPDFQFIDEIVSGKLYLAGLAVLHSFADLTFDLPEVDSIPIWDGDFYRAEEDGNMVVFHSQWSDLPDYKVVLDENGVPAEVSELPSSGETPMPDGWSVGGNG